MWKRHSLKRILFDTHSTANLLPPLPILKKNTFSEKKPSVFKKTQISYVFRILLFPSHSIRQICNNLVEKNPHSESSFCRTRTYRYFQLARKHKKTHHFEWMIFFLYFKYGRKIVTKTL